MVLKIGKQYKKANFGISGSTFRLSEIIVDGELYMFFRMGEKYQNVIEPDGFVYECRCKCSVIPEGIETGLQPHVFVSKEKGYDYTYLGKGKYKRRHDKNRNKIFWQ